MINDTNQTRPILWVKTPSGRTTYLLDTLLLREEMIRLGLGVADIAAAAGKSGTTISVLLNGHRQPSEKVLLKMSQLLGLSDPRDLLQRVPDALRSAEPQDGVTAA